MERGNWLDNRWIIVEFVGYSLGIRWNALGGPRNARGLGLARHFQSIDHFRI